MTQRVNLLVAKADDLSLIDQCNSQVEGENRFQQVGDLHVHGRSSMHAHAHTPQINKDH